MGRSMDTGALDRVLTAAVERGAVPHIAAVAADRDGVIYEGGAGPRTVGESGTVDAGTQFRIMSMTKMVATTAALQQREAGTLDFDTPVAEILPQFADVQVLDGFDGDTPRLRAPKSPATVRNLVTHTSGLGYWFFDEDLARYEKIAGIPNVLGGAGAFAAPMLHDPGDRFTYGINTDWLGKVVETVAGTGLDVVIKEKISGPLGMDDTMFLLDEQRTANAVTVHVPGENGAWSSAGEILPQQPDWWAAGHGLYSTPRDYLRFQRALLGGGELDGERILRPETVEEAFTNQIGALDFPPEIPTADPPITSEFNAGPGWKWGYGLLLNTADIPGGRRAGSGAWAGLFNTHFWIDRTTGVCASVYTNSLPFVLPETYAVYGEFEQALYAAL
ncbi:CubicO group peptidase, beta-lactamase class C family [Pseudonocardia ammonioxydans]|uniref:CubicO group peptidase, beta-lactamase class C family n=1 Tax=Pseudonocardia ammonioxydans TaxID=260086 RepID=A0A1I5GSX8_PSUAM|nr:serine hydrolase domain-containing protein [Pseudonocardia ammonioxydans]SFO39049.1 CubicO group peptidase, beta-lactamase class C family [Pseudonocardia ammonioxydans]